ncbi:MAG: ABC transporter permease subunit [Armatimonadota bacterium]|nr:ABC transporter permease subunit [Armatimonadota bacterium]
MKRSRDLFHWVLHRAPWTISVAPVLALWEVVGRLRLFAFVTPLTDVARAGLLLAGRGSLRADLALTVSAVLVGFGLAVAAGVAVGVLMGRYRLAEAVFGLYVDIFQSTPAAAKVPVLVLLFGLGRGSIVATVFLFAFFVITVNVYTGVRQVSPTLVEMARSFGAGEWTLIRRVILPAALPLVMAGLRMGVGRAVNGAVLGEMLISIVGIGGLLMYYGSSFRVDFLYALILLVVALAAVLMGAVHAIERRLIRWMR